MILRKAFVTYKQRINNEKVQCNDIDCCLLYVKSGENLFTSLTRVSLFQAQTLTPGTWPEGDGRVLSPTTSAC